MRSEVDMFLLLLICIALMLGVGFALLERKRSPLLEDPRLNMPSAKRPHLIP